MGWRELWNHVKATPASRCAAVAVPRDHTDIADALAASFDPGQHYFAVRLHEMLLANEREWASTYDPLVTFVCEFIYDGKEITVPATIGPTALAQGSGVDTPAGRMAFGDIRVAGLHPYRGGRLTITVVLYRVERSNIARDLLGLIGTGAKAFSVSTAIDPYLKIADTLLGGVESIARLDGTRPLVGQHIGHDHDAPGGIAPGYFAVIDRPLQEVDAARLWVRRNQLCIGDSLQAAQPYSGADFLLYSVLRDERRSDLDLLPFQPAWQQVQDEAQTAIAEAWTNAKIRLAGVVQQARRSPDLTAGHAEEIVAGWKAKAVALHRSAEELSTLSRSAPAKADTAEKRARSEAVAVLDL